MTTTTRNETQTIELAEYANGHILDIVVSGKLTGSIYGQIEPAINHLVARTGRIRVFLELRNFDGSTLAGLWEEIKLVLRHHKTIERIAIVSDRPRSETMMSFTKSVAEAEVRYYDSQDIAEARSWIETGLAPTPLKEITLENG